MSLEDDFNDAQLRVKTLTKRPSNEQLLNLYALFKQGTIGDVQGKRPGMMDLKGRAKHDFWSKQKGTDKPEAMQEYVNLVNQLQKDLN